MRNLWSAVLALCLSTTLLSCGPGALVPGVTDPPRAAGGSANIKENPGLVSLGGELATLRGQSLVAVELDQRHQSAEALLAVQEARGLTETIEALGGSTARPEYARLIRALDDAVDSLRRPDQFGSLTQALATAGRATLDIEAEIVGTTSELAAYKASVVSALVNQAASLYELAVADPFDSRYYLGAYGLLREAENMHEGLTTVIEQNLNDDARAADIMFAVMFGAMPSSEPPSDLPPPEEVAAAAYLLGVLLAGSHDAISPPPRNRLAYIAPLLEEALGAYESGEAGVADVLAQNVRASLCCPATSGGDALEAELELLSHAIRSGAADSDITALVEETSALATVAAED